MGNPEARKWLTDHIAKMIEENNVDIYRHDANIDPMNFWPTNEDTERVGIREIRYIEGLYEFWEELKRRKPGLIVECCCSGNRRLRYLFVCWHYAISYRYYCHAFRLSKCDLSTEQLTSHVYSVA